MKGGCNKTICVFRSIRGVQYTALYLADQKSRGPGCSCSCSVMLLFFLSDHVSQWLLEHWWLKLFLHTPVWRTPGTEVLDFYACNVAFIRRGVCVSLEGGGRKRWRQIIHQEILYLRWCLIDFYIVKYSCIINLRLCRGGADKRKLISSSERCI